VHMKDRFDRGKKW